MRITIVQCNILWGRKEDNLAGIEQLLDGCGTTDVVVLPEMFATGFCMKPEEISEPAGGLVVAWMKRMACKLDAAVVGSVAVEDGGSYFNRMLFVEPDGRIRAYDKRHLFGYSGEDDCYTPGTDRVVVDFRGARILLQVCYDLRFPVWSRNCGDYDVALYVASWPVGRIAVWDLLLKARAVENQCFVVGVNRVGKDPLCEYPGNSVVVHPYGRVVAQCVPGEEGCVTADVNLEELGAFRKKFPVLDDADKFDVCL